MKITDAIHEFILYKQSLGMTYKNRALKLTAFARLAGPVEIDDISPETVRRFLDGDRPVTTDWFNKFSALKMLFRFALSRGYATHNPLPISQPKSPRQFRPYIYSVEEVQEMIRVVDNRHRGNWHRLVTWYREDKNVQRLLPHLATYLGHVSIRETSRYLTMNKELLDEASHRFELYDPRRQAMKNDSLLGPWIRRFLLEHLVAERNLSRNTQHSYRDTLRLLLPRIALQSRTTVDVLEVEDLSADAVRNFLANIEEERGCSVATRNQRLSAIHALAHFIGQRSPEHLMWCGEVRNVPFKRTGKNPLTHLEKAEIDALLAAPNPDTEQGQKDHALLLFLYNSGARASEAAAVKISDLEGDNRRGGAVRLCGKGAKIRLCPLWPRTMTILAPLIAGRDADCEVQVLRLAVRPRVIDVQSERNPALRGLLTNRF